MTSWTWSGATYNTVDFYGNGLYDIVSAGSDGQPYPRWVAAGIDLLADAANSLVLTSNTSLAIGTGTKTFTASANQTFGRGSWVQLTDQGNVANYMYGQVTGQVGTSVTFTSTLVGGSGTKTAWDVVGRLGPRGATGAAGTLTAVSGDAAPALGGNLDLNGKKILKLDLLVMMYA